MTPQEMQERLKRFALRCVKLAASLPPSQLGKIVGGQLIRASTGAAANYRATCLARSKRDFVNKLGVVLEEADESVFWIDISTDTGLSKRALVQPLLKEGEEIVRIMVSSKNTASKRKVSCSIFNIQCSIVALVGEAGCQNMLPP
jgi:four helix bundle protein